MNRIAAILSAAALAGCATAAAPGEVPQRTTHVVPYTAANSNATQTSITTFANTGPIASEIAASADEVYAALPGVYGELGIAPGMADAGNRTFGNRRVEASRRLGQVPLSRYLRCGENAFGAPVADSYRIQLAVVSTVAPREGGSTIQTTVEATASSPGQSSSVQCTSTGALERAIANGATLRAAATR